MNCDQVRELEAAYALDALEARDREAIRAHLEGCDQHPELVELRATAVALAMAGPERRPPEALRQRILASAERPEAPVVTPADGGRRNISTFRRWTAAVAAVAVLALGVAAVIIVTTGEDGNQHAHEFTTDDGIRVAVDARLDEPQTELAFAGLAQPPADEEYVLWAIRGTEWLRIGTFTPGDDGTWAGKFAFALQEGDSLCLTMTGTETQAQPFGVPLFMEPI